MSNKKIKIAFIIAEKFPEPEGSFLLDQISGIIDQGFDVKIFVLGNQVETDNNLEDIKKYKILEKTTFLGIPNNKLVRVLRTFPYMLAHPFRALGSLNTNKYGKMALTLLPINYYSIFSRVDKFDIIHSHFGHIGLIGSFLKDSGISGKYVVSFHGGDVNRYPRISGKEVFKHMFRTGDVFTTNSEFTKSMTVKLGSRPDSVKVIQMGVRTDKFSPKKSGKRNNKKVRILTVGRLIEEKGHEYVIRAVARIVKKHKNIEYIITGDGADKEKLENLVKKLEIQKYVKFLGRLPTENDIKKEYEKADIFVLPSVRASYGSAEGQGMVVQEASLMELPIVTSNVGGLPESVIEEKTGFIVPERDDKAIAEKLDILIKSPKLRVEMGKEARKFVKKKFDKKILAEKLGNLYVSLVEDKK